MTDHDIEKQYQAKGSAVTRQLRLMEELSHVLSERVTHFF